MSYKYKAKSLCESDPPIKVKDYDALCEYFSYEAIRQVIRERCRIQVDTITIDAPKDITDIIADMDSPKKGKKMLIKMIDCSALQLLQNDTDQNYAEIFSEETDGLWEISFDEMENFVRKFCDEMDCVDSIVETVKKVMWDEPTELTAEQTDEILLFCALFAYMNHIPEESDERLLGKYLNRNCLQRRKIGAEKLQEDKIYDSPTVLPCYDGNTDNAPLSLHIVIFRNMMTAPALLKLDGMPLQRTLRAGEKILALASGDGSIVTFLPRICSVQDNVISQKGNQLILEGHAEDFLSLENQSAHSCDFSRELADKEKFR